MPKGAIVMPDMRFEGGVKTVVQFIEAALEGTEFQAEVISLAATFRDRNSTSLKRPETWLRRPAITRETDGRTVYTHFGTRPAQLEFVHFWPRPELTEVLDRFDVLKSVENSPIYGEG